FKKYGSKYFYISEGLILNWSEAADFCQRMDSHLADFQSERERTAIIPALTFYKWYWIGMKKNTDGKFVTTIDGKEASFVTWHYGQPNTIDETKRCFFFWDSKMWLGSCDDRLPFICQADYQE
ncbi:hypothetical protein KR018_006868, partial [Drosophila ironensis]